MLTNVSLAAAEAPTDGTSAAPNPTTAQMETTQILRMATPFQHSTMARRYSRPRKPVKPGGPEESQAAEVERRSSATGSPGTS